MHLENSSNIIKKSNFITRFKTCQFQRKGTVVSKSIKIAEANISAYHNMNDETRIERRIRIKWWKTKEKNAQGIQPRR